MTAKPILRENAYLELMSAMTKLLTTGKPYQNCLNCMSWDYSADLCGKFKAKPPTHVLVYSCDEYSDDGEIPFD